ncbi:MAG: transhydrogenase (Re/Si-specific) subunit beta, partial [Moraxellaceae bacterium]|nr:transhydrogenase (Re/Si-specific) subunit beta [Moraxellaceae bacterium]
MENFAQYADWAYLIGAVLFILALRGLSSPASAIMGNRYGMIGMALAVVTTFVVIAGLKHDA